MCKYGSESAFGYFCYIISFVMKENITNLEDLVGPEECSRVAHAIMREKMGQPEDLISGNEAIKRSDNLVDTMFKDIKNENKIPNIVRLK